MEPKYKINPLTGELQEYVFEYNGILVLRNFTAQVDNDRLVVRSASDVNFSILEALVSEVEIDGVLYDNPTAAKEALQRLVFNQNVPVILPEEERKKISSALQSGGYSGTAQDLKKLIDETLRYSNVTDVNKFTDKAGQFEVGDGHNAENAPLPNYWFHYFGGRHQNVSEKYAYQFAMYLNNNENHFWFRNEYYNAVFNEWKKIIGFEDYNKDKRYSRLYNPDGFDFISGNGNINFYYGQLNDSVQRLLGINSEKINSEKNIEAPAFVKKGSSANYFLRGDGSHFPIDQMVVNRGIVKQGDLNTFDYNRDGGIFSVSNGGGSGILISFKAGGSTSSVEFYKPNWYPQTRIGVRNSVDGTRFNEDNGAFRDLAWYADVIRAGVRIGENTTLSVDHQNQVVFVANACSIELNQIQNMGSVSFRKVFDNGAVTFTCTGKKIKYTGDNTFNGKDGSTAVISIYNTTCYIDIKNI